MVRVGAQVAAAAAGVVVDVEALDNLMKVDAGEAHRAMECSMLVGAVEVVSSEVQPSWVGV